MMSLAFTILFHLPPKVNHGYLGSLISEILETVHGGLVAPLLAALS
jgi:hypothetical protein